MYTNQFSVECVHEGYVKFQEYIQWYFIPSFTLYRVMSTLVNIVFLSVGYR